MQRFTTSIEASLVTRNWLAALFLALALPDICAAIEAPERPVGERYKDWFQRYLRASYNPSNMFEMLEAVDTSASERMTSDLIASLKDQPASPSVAFTSEDCYRLRCKCLHQGLPERMGEDRIHFTVPDPSGRMRVHRNVINGVMQLSIDEFCKDVANATLRWWQEIQSNQEAVTRAEGLIKIYGLDAAELPIVDYRGRST